MSDYPATLATQQLTEFLGELMYITDEPAAAQAAAERAARALDAEVGAVLTGETVWAVGFPAERVPKADLAAVAAGHRATIDLPGAGPSPVVAVPIGGAQPGHLIVARVDSSGFTVDEVSLLRGIARVLELQVRTLGLLAAERRQAAENTELLHRLQDRQRLLERLSDIQRAIARRAPLQEIVDAITERTRELFDDDLVMLWLRDNDDADMLLLVSSVGLSSDVASRLWLTPALRAGAAGQAVLRGDLVTAQQYGQWPHRMQELADLGLHGALAAPVRDNGVPVGALAIGRTAPDQPFRERDRQVLQAFADHVSLAVTDASTVDAMNAASHDALTGLANRALFTKRLGNGLARGATEHERTALLFIDLDRFKVVNDSLGHAAGDDLLGQVAIRLRRVLRASDTAARLGGDEFAVLLSPVGTDDDAVRVAARIIDAVSAPFLIDGQEVFVGCSIGIAFGDRGLSSPTALIRAADLAMYHAKRDGRGRYRIFKPAMQDAFQTSLNQEAGLRRAVDRHEYETLYRPIVDLGGGQLVAVETVVGWQRPEQGQQPPAQLQPLAEETGLIVPVGRAVLREACRRAAAWNMERRSRGGSGLQVYAALSGRQWQHPALVEDVAQAITDAGLDPGDLVLELTETLLDQDSAAAAARLGQLKELGVRLAMAEFTIGYSSLACLRQFPIEILMIDSRLVRELSASPQAYPIAEAIVQVGRCMQLITMATGVATAHQHDALTRAGCQFGQGSFYAQPLDAEATEARALPCGFTAAR